MCVIIHLPKGVTMNFAMLKNAVHNNWHSYGLVTKIDGKLDIKRVVPESGEVDPLEVAAALDRDVEFERFLHLRHNTAGATTLENCHPFDVYFSEKRQVVFMHNGTFYDYKSKCFGKDGKPEDDPDGLSDSVNFAEENITPMLVRSRGDIEDPFFQRVIRKFWHGSNRGLLISSDQQPWFIDDWKEIDAGGTKIKVSNTDYFSGVVRGPEFDRRKAAEEALEAKKPKTKDMFQSRVQLPVAPLKTFDFTVPGIGRLSESPINICNDWDVYDREHLVSLANLTKDEWKEMHKDEQTCIFMMDYLSSDYGQLYREHIDLQEKFMKAQKHIETMATASKGEALMTKDKRRAM